MALPDISGLLDMAPAMLRDLPQILGGIQVGYYFVLVLIFGSIIMKSYQGYMHFAAKFLLRLGFGFIALVTGIAISGFIPMLTTDSFYVFIQRIMINPLIGIIISTTVLTLSLFMISHNLFNIPGLKKRIQKLGEKLKRAEEATAKAGSEGIRKLEPVRIVGIVVLAAFLIFSLMNFQGFPSFGDELLSFIGLTPEDIDELGRYMEGFQSPDLPEDCVPIITLIQNNYDDIVSDSLPESTDVGIRSLIESGSGMSIEKVLVVSHEQRTFYIGAAQDNLCSATAGEFCECFDLKEFLQ